MVRIKNLIKKILQRFRNMFWKIMCPYPVAMLKYVANATFYSDKTQTKIFKDAEKEGIHFLPVHFYSPLASTKQIEAVEGEKTRYDNIPGLETDVEGYKALLESLEKYSDELKEIKNERNGSEPFWDNGSFNRNDSALYYLMVRKLKPNKIIEIGSGASTAFAIKALKKNGKGSITAIEPYPSEYLRTLDLEIIEKPVQEFNIDFFKSLNKGDILFIDSTHVSKIGSDVNYLFFSIIPFLKKGVHIHIHDILFPWELQRLGVDYFWCGNHVFWNEQYLLMAFLSFNSNFKINFANAITRTKEFKEPIKKAYYCPDKYGGGSLWFERVK